MRAIDWNHITITDNYMFGTVFRDPLLCQELLERILNIPIDKVVFTGAEHTLSPEIGARGIRMDVHVADSAGTIYDVEVQNANEGNLERRSRYYLSANDIDCIAPGIAYDEMRNSFVIFICTFDPFGRGLSRYTITPHCKEDGVEMPDGTSRIFVNASAWNTCEDARLKPFLQYLSGDTMVDDDFSKKVDQAVRMVRQQPEWRRNRMKLERYLEEQRIKAIREGRAEGRAEDQRANAALAAALVEASREQELVEAMLNEDVRQRLLAEFGIHMGS